MKMPAITIESVTPIWTGGIDRSSDRIHATGIIGSLRWWYEALVRGFGGMACDPSAHTCNFNQEQFAKEKDTDLRSRLQKAGLCHACQVFGATGWARRFRLVVKDNTRGSQLLQGSKQTTGNRFKQDGRTRPTWYYNGGRENNFQVTVVPVYSPKTGTFAFNPQIILGLLKLLENHGSLGAKPQLGYGRIRVIDPSEFDKEEFLNHFSFGTPPDIIGVNAGKPALTEMFFGEVTTEQVKDPVIPVINVKYDLRVAFRTEPKKLGAGDRKTLRHFVCGKEKPDRERKAAKVALSLPIDGRLYIWGWIPERLPVSGVSRNDVLDLIQGAVKNFGQIKKWREFNSARDTEGMFTDPAAYLRSLL